MAQSQILENDPIDKFWSRLREDAIQHEMLELALVYGCQQIKRREEILGQISISSDKGA